MIFIVLAVSSLSAQNYTSYKLGNSSDATVAVKAGFVLAGGGTDNDDAMRWMLSRAQGGDVLILRASGSNGYNKYFYSDLGISLNSVESIVFNNKAASSESYILDKIRKAEIIFFAGGDQGKYYDYWADTPVGALLQDVTTSGTKIIGGTSAGMMILGNIIYAPTGNGVTSDEALSNPYHANMAEMRYGTFLRIPAFEKVVFDTHFDNRTRSGRLLTFMARAAKDTGNRVKAIACNESTAVCIDENNNAVVFGDSPKYTDYAYFLEVNCEYDWEPQTVSSSQRLHWVKPNENAVVVQRLDGTKDGTVKFDLRNWKAISNVTLEKWQANNGILEKKSGLNSNCRTDISSSLTTVQYNPQVYPNPAMEKIYFDEADTAFLSTFDGKVVHKCLNCSSIAIGQYIDLFLILTLKKGDATRYYKVMTQ